MQLLSGIYYNSTASVNQVEREIKKCLDNFFIRSFIRFFSSRTSKTNMKFTFRELIEPKTI